MPAKKQAEKPRASTSPVQQLRDDVESDLRGISNEIESYAKRITALEDGLAALVRAVSSKAGITLD